MPSSKCLSMLILCAVACTVRAQSADPLLAVQGEFDQKVLPFLATNCIVCHSAEKQAGDFNLEQYKTVDTLAKNRDAWRLALQMMTTGEMPPKTMPANKTPPGGLPKPSDEDRQATIKWITGEFDRADHQTKPQAGRVTARRLNKVEYNNTIQDLLGIKLWPADDFPQDDASHGFDNIADSLSVSPILMEKYVNAAEKAARSAIYGPEKMAPSVKKLEQLEREVTNNTTIPKEYDETGLTNDRSLHAIHRFPVDGVYLFRLTSRGFRPLGCEPLEIGLWLDGKLVAEAKVDPKEDGPSLLGGRQDLFGKPQDVKMYVTAGDHWVAGSVLRMYEGLPPIYGGKNPSTRPAPASQPVVQLQGVEQQQQQAQAPNDVQGVAVPASQPAVAAAIPASQPAQQLANGAQDPNQPAGRRGGRGGRRGGRGGGGGNRLAPVDTQIGMDYIDVIGPLEQKAGPTPESIVKLFGTETFDRTKPDAARQVLNRLAHRAFRRPVTPQEVDRFVALYEMVRKEGDSFEEGIVVAMQAILVSPDFLFRIERDRPVIDKSDNASLLSDHELAARLSYFLWSTMPDDALLAAADSGTLRKPEVLEAQVKRMIADPRSQSLAQNFAGQWLRTRALESSTPDFVQFPEYDFYLRLSMQQETEHFFDYILRNNQSILDFIDSNYSFLNERLANFYGIKGVTGTEFRKVDLSGTERGGVMTQGSVLVVSSYATRTSPVLRGKWVLENILNAAPPPPPDNVPALEATIKNNPNASMRDQLALHRTNPTCAGCHSRMDPLGIGLENFNAIGAWRTEDNKQPIDASGTLPDGRTFKGPKELRALVLADKEAFAECLADKLLTYAIGRGLEAYDRPTVKQIATNVSKNEYHFDSLIFEIVKSLPFQKRTSNPVTVGSSQ